ncbi:hypothetical protein DENSPDRAFT_834586 [Dentipellis sp. KUC8613]|nr:hypothetical protein DENSPDRAFT_834586 [Dentipellis sp. KUC8613]
MENTPFNSTLDADVDLSKSFDEDIEENVLPVLRLSAGARRFMQYKPSKKPKKPRKRKNPGSPVAPAPKRKNAADHDDVLDNDNDEGSSAEDPPRKRTKTIDSDEDEDDTVDRQATAYIHVVVPGSPVASSSRSGRGGKSSKTASDQTLHRGPFFFSLTMKYDSFLKELALATPCRVEGLVVSRMSWKFEKPQNSQTKALTNATGYEAMIRALKEKKKDRIVIIVMPAPTKAPDAVPWDTGDDQNINEGQDIGEELMARSPDDAVVSARDQLLGLDASSKLAFEALCECYPVGNNALFPGKRIYSKGNQYWELTDMRLRVWASHISQKGASKETAPLSVHFGVDKCIKPPASTPATGLAMPIPSPGALAVMQSPSDSSVLQALQSGLNPLLAFSSLGPASLLSSASLLGGIPQFQLLQQLLQPSLNASSVSQPISSTSTSSLPGAKTTSAPASPGTMSNHRVSLDMFCELYDISPADKVKLEKLEVLPGEKAVETLGRQDWGDIAGFSKLAWDRFITKHRQFRQDLRDGKFE